MKSAFVWKLSDTLGVVVIGGAAPAPIDPWLHARYSLSGQPATSSCGGQSRENEEEKPAWD